MARIITNFTNVDAPGGDYSNGKIRDRDGATPGTPGNENTYGDIHQFFAELMKLGGLTANGNPDNDANGYQFKQALINYIEQEIPDLATKQEAEDRTNNLKTITPLRAFQGWLHWVQTETVSALQTVSKYIVGAINELNNIVKPTSDMLVVLANQDCFLNDPGLTNPDSDTWVTTNDSQVIINNETYSLDGGVGGSAPWWIKPSSTAGVAEVVFSDPGGDRIQIDNASSVVLYEDVFGDQGLNTTDKTFTGAINELKSGKAELSGGNTFSGQQSAPDGYNTGDVALKWKKISMGQTEFNGDVGPPKVYSFAHGLDASKILFVSCKVFDDNDNALVVSSSFGDENINSGFRIFITSTDIQFEIYGDTIFNHNNEFDNASYVDRGYITIFYEP